MTLPANPAPKPEYIEVSARDMVLVVNGIQVDWNNPTAHHVAPVVKPKAKARKKK